jgi:hypothetical protein
MVRIMSFDISQECPRCHRTAADCKARRDCATVELARYIRLLHAVVVDVSELLGTAPDVTIYLPAGAYDALARLMLRVGTPPGEEFRFAPRVLVCRRTA